MAEEEQADNFNGPIPTEKLSEIATQACEAAFESAEVYDHAQTTTWNTNIINSILQSLLAETSSENQPAQHKFAVTSTIIQHTSIHEAANSPDNTAGGKRGMHSATGAYWNNEKDGMWSHKHEEDEKGFDVVISVIWISLN